MATVDTLARGLVALTDTDTPGFYRAEGIERVRRPAQAYTLDFLLIGQDFDLNRNQILATAVAVDFFPVVSAIFIDGRVGFRIHAVYPGAPTAQAPVYFQVLETIAGTDTVIVPAL